jgi:hypothetical protein
LLDDDAGRARLDEGGVRVLASRASPTEPTLTIRVSPICRSKGRGLPANDDVGGIIADERAHLLVGHVVGDGLRGVERRPVDEEDLAAGFDGDAAGLR